MRLSFKGTRPLQYRAPPTCIQGATARDDTHIWHGEKAPALYLFSPIVTRPHDSSMNFPLDQAKLRQLNQLREEFCL